jgi:tetratricopeptide (TPR) repeat protein
MVVEAGASMAAEATAADPASISGNGIRRMSFTAHPPFLVLRQMIQRQPAYANAYALLGLIYEKQGQVDDARAIYRQAWAIKELPGRDRDRLEARLRALPPPKLDN